MPTEKSQTLQNGKRRVVETKLYPGYVFVEMKLEDDGRIQQDVFFLIKTTGGDFVTAGRPTPMTPDEVEKMLFDPRVPDSEAEVKLEFEKGDNVTINEGPFSYEGTVDEVLPERGIVRVLVTIFVVKLQWNWSTGKLPKLSPEPTKMDLLFSAIPRVALHARPFFCPTGYSVCCGTSCRGRSPRRLGLD